MRRFTTLVLAVVYVLAQAACRSHSSDAKLQNWFWLHSSEFKELLTLAQSDSAITVQPKSLTIEFEPGRLQTFMIRDDSELPTGVSRERWHKYQKLLSSLRVGTLYKDKQRVMFQMDEPGILNGDSQKGVLYSQKNQPSRQSLDGLTVADLRTSSCEATKKIQDGWYLYLSYSFN